MTGNGGPVQGRRRVFAPCEPWRAMHTEQTGHAAEWGGMEGRRHANPYQSYPWSRTFLLACVHPELRADAVGRGDDIPGGGRDLVHERVQLACTV